MHIQCPQTSYTFMSNKLLINVVVTGQFHNSRSNHATGNTIPFIQYALP